MLFHLTTAVWGPWHTGVFLEANLPSLLAPGNLGALASRHHVVYRIFSSRGDIQKIQETPAYQRAREIMRFELIECDLDAVDNPLAMHHSLWQRSIDEAREAGAMVLFVPPDVIWADGSLAHVAQLAADGKRAILSTYVRVVCETAVPAVKRGFTSGDAPVIQVSPRQLVRVALEHIHPLALAYLRDSPNFPVHPELVLWPVAGEGLLMRVLCRELFAFDPRQFHLNRLAQLEDVKDPHLIHLITDSDDLFAVSLAPLEKDFEWYAKPEPLSPLNIGKWWLIYDSPANDLIVRQPIYIHDRPMTRAKWRRAEIESGFFINKILGIREILRALAWMPENETAHVRHIVSMALLETRLAELLDADQRVTLFLPRDPAVVKWMLRDDGRATLERADRALVDLILSHIALGRIDIQPDREISVPTLGSASRTIAWRGDRAMLDGVEVRLPGFAVRRHWAYLVNGLLPTVVASPTARVASPSPAF